MLVYLWLAVFAVLAIFVHKWFSSIYVPDFENNKFRYRIVSLIKNSLGYIASTLSLLRIGNEPSNFRKLVEIVTRWSIKKQTANIRV
jgi:hypothetical protein